MGLQHIERNHFRSSLQQLNPMAMTTKDKQTHTGLSRRAWLPIAIVYGAILLLGFFAKLHG